MAAASSRGAPDLHDGVAIRDYLQRAYGYSATGESREHIINFLTGTGRNGKSVERNAVQHVLADYGYVLPFETLEQVRGGRPTNDLAPLHRKRMAVSSEANKGVRLDTRRIKALTGEDDISARYMYKEFTTFRSTATLWVAVNDKPAVSDDSDGFWQRVRVVPYPMTFEGATADPTLNETFENDEAMGILAWIVEGARLFYENGLGAVPESVQSTTRDYRAENDPIAEFIEDRCTRHPDGREVFKDLYSSLTSWAESQGLPQRERPTSREVKRYFRAHFQPGGPVTDAATRASTSMPSLRCSRPRGRCQATRPRPTPSQTLMRSSRARTRRTTNGGHDEEPRACLRGHGVASVPAEARPEVATHHARVQGRHHGRTDRRPVVVRQARREHRLRHRDRLLRPRRGRA